MTFRPARQPLPRPWGRAARDSAPPCWGLSSPTAARCLSPGGLSLCLNYRGRRRRPLKTKRVPITELPVKSQSDAEWKPGAALPAAPIDSLPAPPKTLSEAEPLGWGAAGVAERTPPHPVPPQRQALLSAGGGATPQQLCLPVREGLWLASCSIRAGGSSGRRREVCWPRAHRAGLGTRTAASLGSVLGSGLHGSGIPSQRWCPPTQGVCENIQ